jgi:hypothetical protein
MQRWDDVRRVAALTAVSALAAAVLVVTGAGPGATAPAPHCAVRVLGQGADGELRTTAVTCSATRATAIAAAAGATAADWTIGTHYDGFNLTGGSFSVVGSGCIGGWLNLPPAWVNRVSSTWHGCGHIRHFDGYDLVSPNQMTIYPGGNLSSLNNKANSIQYLP